MVWATEVFFPQSSVAFQVLVSDWEQPLPVWTSETSMARLASQLSVKVGAVNAARLAWHVGHMHRALLRLVRYRCIQHWCCGLGAGVWSFGDATAPQLPDDFGQLRQVLQHAVDAQHLLPATGSQQAAQLARFAEAARAALQAGLGVNAGHDLNRDNLTAFIRQVPGVAEVSIGHALIADALELGYTATIQDYLRCIAQGQ